MATKPQERQWVSREYGSVSSYSSLPEVIKQLQEALKDKNWKDLVIDLSQYTYGESWYISIEGKRLENDKEMAERLAQEEQRAKWQEERDRADFERLKEKYAKK